MSAAAKKTQDAASTAVAVQQDPGLPAFLDELEAHAGEGTSQSMEDTGMPLLYVAQKMSPEVNKQDPLFLKGLEVGDVYCKTTRMFWPGQPTTEAGNMDQALVVTPITHQKRMVEWGPEKGKYIGTHPFNTPLVRKALKTDKGLVLQNGNRLVETDYHFCLLPDGRPIVIPMSSTQLSKASRPWINLKNEFKLPSGKIAPAYARKYRIETRYMKNDKGDWYVYAAVDAGWQQDADLRRLAIQTFQDLQNGLLNIETPQESGASIEDDESIPV
jgi:hypothetical protein